MINRRQFRPGTAIVLLCTVFFPLVAAATGSANAFRTLVVVNTNSANSVELGNYYAAVHGIPGHHICTVSTVTNWGYISSNDFHDLIYSPITNHIAANNLAGQIDFIVLCQDLPTRVEYGESTTASLFYGFKDAPRYAEAGCNLPVYTSNEYYQAEQSFSSAAGWNNTNGFIAFQLVASNLPTAKLVADRGTAAQSTFPNSSINLYMLGSAGRSGREARYDNTRFSFTALPGLTPSCVIAPYYSVMSGVTNVIGYQDGYGYIPAGTQTNNLWIDGAYADHLTSCGGMILNPCLSQHTVLHWMGIGATASYGTVDEPCAYLEKFPNPLMGFWYARGFTIGEAYAMSVEAPYQGLFAGDPLAAPFAAPPVTTCSSHTPGQIVTGTVQVAISASSHALGVPAARLDFYLDDVFQTNRASLSPVKNNKLSIAVNGHTNSATVTVINDTLVEAVQSLANTINTDPLSVVSAAARGDRIELIYDNYNHDGDNLPVSASVSAGTASSLTLGVGLAATNLHPSIYPARKLLELYTWTTAGANAGDTITNIITLTNGVAVTNILIAAQDEKVTNLLERLRIAITTNSTLMATNGVRYERLANGIANVLNSGTLFARTPGPDGYPIQIQYLVSAVSNNSGLYTGTSFTSFMNDNTNDVRPRASVLFHVTPTNGILTDTLSLDTAGLSDGLHTLDFIARDGSAVAAPSRFTLPLIICNSSPQLSLVGTNGTAVTNGEPASLDKGTDFGPVNAGASSTNVFTLHNNGTAALSITGWSTNGTGADAFGISGIPSSIDAGGSSHCTVVFTPSGNASFSMSLEIESDAVVPQTNLLFSGTGVVYSLTVSSEHGTPDPAAGTYTNLLFGTVLTNSVAVPSAGGGTQLVGSGWAMTGNEPLGGGTTNFTMTITNDASLTWLWATNYWLTPTAGLHGSVNVSPSWQAGGTTTQITASADEYYSFTHWTGDASGGSNPLALLMDAPKSVQANFAENLATNSTPEWWLASYGWTNNFDAAATNDADSDGYFTWQEYICDTDPTNAASVFLPMNADLSASNLTFTFFQTSTGRTYSLDLSSTPLTNPAWNSVTSSIGNGTNWIPAPTPPGTGYHYYRGRVFPTP